MNPAFDLTHTYILLSGIGGANPDAVTVGSAVWVRQVIVAGELLRHWPQYQGKTP